MLHSLRKLTNKPNRICYNDKTSKNAIHNLIIIFNKLDEKNEY